MTTTSTDGKGKQQQSSELIHTNQKHPFLTEEQGFVPAGEIVAGMHIVRADGSVGLVSRWQVVPGTQMMYNLTVAQDHTFTVGDGQWVVHNCEIPGGFKNGITPEEITAINKQFGGSGSYGSVETTLIAAQYRNGFWNKAAVLVRDIAGGHLYSNGNKRTAHAIVDLLVQRNNIMTGAGRSQMKKVIWNVAEGKLRDISDIANRLRGY